MTTTSRYGCLLDVRTADMLDEANRLCGIQVRCTQGSYSTGVSASAGTHAGGGSCDLSVSGLDNSQVDALVLALRQVGFAAWHRTPAQGFDSYHIHAIAGGQSDLSPGARDQWADYLNGRNGLANNGADDGPRDFHYVGITWEQYGGDDMTPEQATLLGNIGYAVDQIRQVDLPPIRAAVERIDDLEAAVARLEGSS